MASLESYTDYGMLSNTSFTGELVQLLNHQHHKCTFSKPRCGLEKLKDTYYVPDYMTATNSTRDINRNLQGFFVCLFFIKSWHVLDVTLGQAFDIGT